MDNLIYSTVPEILAVTVFSFYVTVTYALWIPLTKGFPEVLHLILQFILIGIPQVTVIIRPKLVLYFYFGFGVFGMLGAVLSYIRFLNVRKIFKSSLTDGSDVETGSLIGFSNLTSALQQHFTNKPNHIKRLNDISSFQSSIMIMTITAISAVDFKIFPPHFRKSKIYGLSLMDIGVALVVTASGLVMPKYLHGPSKLRFGRLLKASYPVLVLGIGKSILTSVFHIGAAEYGTHWNFLINLFILPFSLILANFLPNVHLVPLSCIVIMGVYDYFLKFRGLSEYILAKDESNLYSANKVGIFSLIGFICLFLMSCYIGKLYQLKAHQPKRFVISMVSACIVLWSTFILLDKHFPSSRLFANSSFVVWGLANGTLQATMYGVFDLIFSERYHFLIYHDMISDYRLSTFMLGNLLCGLVKMCFDTRSSSVAYTLSVIYSYVLSIVLLISLAYYGVLGKMRSALQKHKK